MGDSRTPTSTLAGRAVIAILLMVVAFSLGYWLGGYIAGYTDQYDLLRKGVPALGVGLLLGMVRQVTFLLGNMMDYVKTGTKLEAWKPTMGVLFVGLTIALSLHLLKLTVDEVSEANAGTIVVWEGRKPAAPAAENTGPYAVFPVFFYSEASGYDPAAQTFASGTSLTASEARMVGNLGASLDACASGSESGVQVSVRGFASSSGYRGYTDEEAAQINLLVANSRARAVAGALGSTTGVAVDVTEWGSIADLEAAQAFADDVAEEYRPEHGFLTRRAEILLEDPGSCRVE